MLEYNICNVFDEKTFLKQCAAIEKHIPNLTKNNLLVDIDGSQLQVYTFQNGDKIKVINDLDFGIVIQSTIDIEKYF